MSEQIIGIERWWNQPLGRYLLDWEQTCYDDAVANVFGFHSLQLGCFPLQGLRCNRMPHRWLALEPQEAQQLAEAERDASLQTFAKGLPAAEGLHETHPLPLQAALQCSPQALPFAENSLDLVLLPHSLECSEDPHAVLREVARVLVPQGRVLISGINPASLWGLRSWAGARRWAAPLPGLPPDGQLIGYGRLRDWLKLLDLELEAASFGCYRPALQSQRWLQRYGWLDRIGAGGWPVAGGAYFVEAVKKVAGTHRMAVPWQERKAAAVARPAATRAPTPGHI
ncbi:methyltransferase domain-containing protein [Comamonas humi]